MMFFSSLFFFKCAVHVLSRLYTLYTCRILCPINSGEAFVLASRFVAVLVAVAVVVARCMTFADCRLQTADFGLQTADCRLQTADCRLQTADRICFLMQEMKTRTCRNAMPLLKSMRWLVELQSNNIHLMKKGKL